MIDIDEKDFTSLSHFSLNWRWTDPKWNQLPENVLSQIRPLCEAKARELWEQPLILGASSRLEADLVDHVTELEPSQDEQKVRHWLQQRVSNDRQQVFITWDRQTAVLTTWKVFCDYWDDFCYPSSDDVTICPLSADWVLRYNHSGRFSFGPRHV